MFAKILEPGNRCVCCGYSLDGLPSDKKTCPECGLSIDKNAIVVLVRQKLFRLIPTVFFLSSTALLFHIARLPDQFNWVRFASFGYLIISACLIIVLINTTDSRWVISGGKVVRVRRGAPEPAIDVSAIRRVGISSIRPDTITIDLAMESGTLQTKRIWLGSARACQVFKEALDSARTIDHCIDH